MAEDKIIRGQIAQFTTRKDDGWCVLDLDCDDGTIVRVTGVFPEIVEEGDTIEVAGKMVTNKYGDQFRASHMVSCLSGKPELIEVWLQTNLPQIGPARAKEIVTRFRAQLWYVIEREPQQLLEVSGLTQARVDEIVVAYRKVRAQRDYVLQLTRAGLSIKDAAQIMSELGHDAFTILEGDPYAALLRRKVPFETADKVAQKLFKVSPTDARRVRAFAREVLFEATYREGHCYMVLFELVSKTGEQLKLKDAVVAEALKDYAEIVRHDKRVMLLDIDEAERTVADTIRNMLCMGSAVYSEILPYPAQWLRNLIAADAIAPGTVLEGDISQVRAHNVHDATQAHFFAGIGIWSHALRTVGWPDDLPVWTGSCPCQPFSIAGKRKGTDDARHLWPVWFKLITECRPPVIFGEQVASADGLNWFDAVQTDLENAGYAVGAADLCAAGVGAPHKRQRLYFVAHALDQRRAWLDALLRARAAGRFAPELPEAAGRGETCGGDVADAGGDRLQGGTDSGAGQGTGAIGWRPANGSVCSMPTGHDDSTDASRDAGVALGDTCITGSRWDARAVSSAQAQGSSERGAAGDQPHVVVPAGATSGFWADAEWLACSDGKARCVEPGTFPLVARDPSVVGRLHAYGNAIVGPLACTFIRAYIETCFDAAR